MHSVSTSATITLLAAHVILQFSLHDSADGDDVTADDVIDEIVLNLTIDSLRHLTSIDVLDIIIDLLDSQSLEE